MKKIIVVAFCLAFSSISSAGLVGFADVVLDFQDNAQNVKGELGGGGFRDLSFNRAADGTITGEVADAVLGNDDTSYLSLLSGQSITLGFVDENIIDSTGFDVFVSELGSASESASIFASSNGIDFTLIGVANNAGGVSSFDLLGFGFTQPISAIKILSSSSGGSSPGFDLEFVEALNSVAVEPPVDVNAPTTAILMLCGVFAAFARRLKA